MIVLKETIVACPKDGHNLFLITKEPDVGVGDAEQMGVVCRHCDPREFFEVLKNARVINLEKPRDQKLKL